MASKPVRLSSSYFTFEPFGISMTTRKCWSIRSPRSTSCQACITDSVSRRLQGRDLVEPRRGARRDGWQNYTKMERTEVERILVAAEQELARGASVDLRRLGFWRAVEAVKDRQDWIEAYGERIS